MRRVFPAAIVGCVLAACGPGPGAAEPVPTGAGTTAADAAPGDPPAGPDVDPAGEGDAGDTGPEASAAAAPAPIPPGFEELAVPEGATCARIAWRVEGARTAEAMEEALTGALPDVAACLGAGAPGEILPLHFIVGPEGRVQEIGGPFAETARGADVTCAQTALRPMRFPAADGDATVRLFFGW